MAADQRMVIRCYRDGVASFVHDVSHLTPPIQRALSQPSCCRQKGKLIWIMPPGGGGDGRGGWEPSLPARIHPQAVGTKLAKHKAPVITAKLDRLSRDVHFISGLNGAEGAVHRHRARPPCLLIHYQPIICSSSVMIISSRAASVFVQGAGVVIAGARSDVAAPRFKASRAAHSKQAAFRSGLDASRTTLGRALACNEARADRDCWRFGLARATSS